LHPSLELIAFLIAASGVSVAWGRINRIGYGRLITSIVHFIMKYSRTDTELIRSYLVWILYLFTGFGAAVALFVLFRVNILHFLGLEEGWVLIPLAFVAQNAMTGLMMQSVLSAWPTLNVFAEIGSIPWIRYSLIMPGAMRAVSPLVAALFEELFFRGAVFLVLLERFPETGGVFATAVCTVLFVLQQVLQVDTRGQAVIMAIGSTSISVVGCIVTLHTGSFLPTLVCHAAYAFFYLQLGSASSKWASLRQVPSMPTTKVQGPKPSSVYSAY
jgi:membrane protease YdiL (CAAX protease family)